MSIDRRWRARSVVVLAGGSNTRMESLRGTIYKAFLPVHGMSFVARHVLRAQAYGIATVDVIVDEPDPVLNLLATPADEVGHTKASEVRVLIHRGTQAEKMTWWHTHSDQAPPTLVVLGDTLAPVDLAALWQLAASGRFDSAIAVAELRLPFGFVQITDDHVTAFHERPVIDLPVNTGYMVVGRILLGYLRDGMALSDALARLADESLLGCLPCPGPMITADSIESLTAAHAHLGDETITNDP